MRQSLEWKGHLSKNVWVDRCLEGSQQGITIRSGPEETCVSVILPDVTTGHHFEAPDETLINPLHTSSRHPRHDSGAADESFAIRVLLSGPNVRHAAEVSFGGWNVN